MHPYVDQNLEYYVELMANGKSASRISSVVPIVPQHAAITTASRASAILDSPSTLANAVISPSQKESMLSSSKTFATSACPIAQSSIAVPSEVAKNAEMVKAENLHANVHLGLWKANEADDKLQHILMKMKDLLNEMFKKKCQTCLPRRGFKNLLSTRLF